MADYLFSVSSYRYIYPVYPFAFYLATISESSNIILLSFCSHYSSVFWLLLGPKMFRYTFPWNLTRSCLSILVVAQVLHSHKLTNIWHYNQHIITLYQVNLYLILKETSIGFKSETEWHEKWTLINNGYPERIGRHWLCG